MFEMARNYTGHNVKLSKGIVVMAKAKAKTAF